MGGWAPKPPVLESMESDRLVGKSAGFDTTVHLKGSTEDHIKRYRATIRILLNENLI